MNDYSGYKELSLSSIDMSEEDLNALLSGDSQNSCGCLENEYLLLKDDTDSELGIYKFSKSILAKIPYKSINTRFIGKVKPRNSQQQMAIDLLYDSNTTVKVITGKFGTGKDFLMCSAAIDLLEKGQFEKIVYVRNNIEVKNSKPIGFLPGSYNEKLLPFAMPLADHLGGADGLSLMINHGQIEVVHLGFIRGRDIKNSIIMCSEAENLTKEHIQLLLGRVGEGSSLWINGDFKQCDASVFEHNSGLMTVVDKLKGHPRFGYVKLIKTERSETAAMADLLD